MYTYIFKPVHETEKDELLLGLIANFFTKSLCIEGVCVAGFWEIEYSHFFAVTYLT